MNDLQELLSIALLAEVDGITKNQADQCAGICLLLLVNTGSLSLDNPTPAPYDIEIPDFVNRNGVW